MSIFRLGPYIILRRDAPGLNEGEINRVVDIQGTSCVLYEMNQIASLKNRCASAVATCFGAGLSPYAPGTLGSLASLPLVYYACNWDIALKISLWCLITMVGTWASGVFDTLRGSNDNRSIVIDEVVGMGITAFTAGRNLSTLAVALLLFRALDILKPPPIHQLDEWSKRKTRRNSPSWRRGFGVMADDIVAGFMGLAIIIALQRLGILD